MAARTIPPLATALSESFGPYDAGRFKGLYDQAVTQPFSEYDAITEMGRRSLEDTLARRGVAGTSFGAADLGNYSATRAEGRKALQGQWAPTQAQFAKQIMSGDLIRTAEKNRVLGAGLDAFGRAIAPQRPVR
jgi:hypothetical protein